VTASAAGRADPSRGIVGGGGKAFLS
jgi:hypothetical protein